MIAERNLNPSELTSEQLDRIAFALVPHIRQHLNEEVLTRKQAAAFMKKSLRQFDRYIENQKVRSHKLVDNEFPMYLKSELIAAIKNA